MRRSSGWGVWVVLVAACATTPRPPAPPSQEPFTAAFVALAARRHAEAARRFAESATRHPMLEDYALYFRSRALARAGRRADAIDAAARIASGDSVWGGAARLLAGELLRVDDPNLARAWLLAARDTLPPPGDAWARAMLALAGVEHARGDDAAALGLAYEIRRVRPRSVAAKRARRMVARLRAAEPSLPFPPAVEEAELRLREGDARGALDAGRTALETAADDGERARALWVRAQAERALGDRDAAEETCRLLAGAVPGDALAPRALAAAAAWRWNADDDARARVLFDEVATRFPGAPQAADALYGLGRIAQEAERWDEAFRAYTSLRDRHPGSPLAGEAAWRAAWVRYLAGDFVTAERLFHRLAAGGGTNAARASAEYWRARALAHLGRPDDAEQRLAQVSERYPTSYYADLAEERLGRTSAATVAVAPLPPPRFPAALDGVHADRARLLARLGFVRFARAELDALAATGTARDLLLDAYVAVGAPGAALRLAREVHNDPNGPLARYLYPLGYWHAVSTAARTHAVDPLLVTALIRQESLFDPAAVSPANAHGLMQLLPRTARELLGSATETVPPSLLHDPDTNVRLGVTLLARLVARYGGSLPKALAAYNAGEEAVAKWERRHSRRAPDEFVELISYRETREYVKTVLGNYRLYRRLYAVPIAASADTRSAGRPPKAPFDITTTTSPARAVDTT
jgi:soluble lytic murein transglycosylase